jgi:hypothetical protein
MPESDNALSLRPQVESLERAMRDLPQVDIPVQHGFGPGFYARTITIPADTLLTGEVHATEHIFMVTRGDITITTDTGTVRVQAPYQAICKAGGKRAGYTHAETVCVNIHITPETDLAKLRASLIEAPALAAPEAQKEIP